MENDIGSFLLNIFQNFQTMGVLGGLAMLFSGFIGILKMEWFQNILPSKYKWDSWSGVTKFFVVLMLALIGGIFGSLAVGGTIIAGIIAGLSVAVGSMGIKGAKTAMLPKNTDSLIC